MKIDDEKVLLFLLKIGMSRSIQEVLPLELIEKISNDESDLIEKLSFSLLNFLKAFSEEA